MWNTLWDELREIAWLASVIGALSVLGEGSLHRRTPINASPRPSRATAHDSADRYCFIETDFHHLLLAGLPVSLKDFGEARTNSARAAAQIPDKRGRAECGRR